MFGQVEDFGILPLFPGDHFRSYCPKRLTYEIDLKPKAIFTNVAHMVGIPKVLDISTPGTSRITRNQDAK